MGRSLLHIQRTTNHQIQTTSYNMSVSFKVTLSNGEEQETRRFQVDKEVAGSLIYLKQKIAAIFPELRRSEPVLSWVDEDGDEGSDIGRGAQGCLDRLDWPCLQAQGEAGGQSKRVAPRSHLARQVNPILGDPNIQVLANLFGGRPWVNGCQGMRPAMPATKNQAMPAEPKDTKPAEKKPETEKIAEAKKTERGEPSKPATT